MSRTAGFTLLEVLVAITLASLLLSSIYGVFATTSTAKEQVEKQAAAMHLGRVLIARLDRELLGLALDNQGDQPALLGGVNSQGEAYLELITSSSGGPQPGMRLVYYRLGNDSDQTLILWRAETGLNSPVAASEERMAPGINQLVFSFFDGRSWRDSWNSLNDGRPVLVRAAVKLDGLGAASPLQSVFDLPHSRRSR